MVTLVIWKLLFFLPPLMIPGVLDLDTEGRVGGGWDSLKGFRRPWNTGATW